VIEIAGLMTPEDLARFRMAYARTSSIESGVSGYSPREAEEAIIALWKLTEELARRYSLETAVGWYFDPYLGHIWREDCGCDH